MPRSPNVVLIMADEWRGDALGCMGDEQVRTPALDGLAADGVVFDRAYTPYPLCSPARGSIQTGCYPIQHRAVTNSNKKIPLSHDRETIAERLKSAGYRTGYIGKWHLGGRIGAPGFVPPEDRRGYDFWEGFDVGHDHHRGHPRWDESGSLWWDTGYQPDVQTDIAVDFIDEAADEDDPFFLCLSWGPPHMPFQAPAEYRDLYDRDALELRPNVPRGPEAFANSYAGPYHDDPRETLAQYYGMITSLDDNIRRLIRAMRSHGLSGETLVVFTSDHGEQMGSQGRWGKNTPYEESIHIPLIWWHPGRIPAGRATEGFANLIDVMPTVLGYCGLEVPRNVQGRDLSDYLTASATDRKAANLWETAYIQNGITYDGWRALRTDQFLFSVGPDLSTKQLFDMAADPYQQENLAGRAARDGDIPLAKLRRRLVEAAFRFDDYHFKSRASFDFDTREMTFDFGDDQLTFDAGTERRLDELRR